MDTLKNHKVSSLTSNKRNDLLKLMAMITMLIDHIGLLFYPHIMLYRTIGRIAFPIFAYQLCTGYSKTHNLIAYIKRLLIFACISQVPYVFLNRNMDLNLFRINVIFLFLYGIFVLYIFDKTTYKFHEIKSDINFFNIMIWLFLCSTLIVIIFLPIILEIMFSQFTFSYSTYGILIILIFHIFKNQRVNILITYILISFFTTYLKGGVYLIHNYENPFIRLEVYINNLATRHDLILKNILTWQGGLMSLSGYFFQLRSLLGISTIFIFETISSSFKLNKYVAYWFYPLHITILLILNLMINQKSL